MADLFSKFKKDKTSSPQGERELRQEAHQLEREGAIKPSDTAEQVVSEFIEEGKRQELDRELEEFQQDLHSTPSGVTQSGAISATENVSLPKSEFLIQVENIMADGLGDLYANMEPSLKQKFKLKGEEIARMIEKAVLHGKSKVKQVLKWIRDWLKIIPGVNRFFLEQEAKIKTDKIMKMVK